MEGLEGTDDFLVLLVEQLRNQDPLEPMDSAGFMTQLVQLNSLEQSHELSQQMASVATAQRNVLASSLLGGEIEYVDSSGSLCMGQVTEIKFGAEADPGLVVDGVWISLDQVTTVVLPTEG